MHDIEQFRCRTLYFNCYLDRILLLSNCIGPYASAGDIYINNTIDKGREILERFVTRAQLIHWKPVNTG